MKSFALFALSAVALAAPILEKRSTVYTTVVEEVFETVFTTTTVWLEPTDEPRSSIGAFYEVAPASITPTSSVAAPIKTEAPAAAPQVVAPVIAAPYVAPVPVVAAPAPAATTKAPEPAYVAPAPPAYIAPSTPAYVAPVAPVSSPASPAAPASGGYSGGGGKGDHTGDMTYYDVAVGLGSCGTSASNSENVVALSHLDMQNGANPNANPKCGTMINIYSDTGVHQARVFDTCPVCASGSLDVPEGLFKLIAPNGDGRVKGVSWSFA
jgi:hypothetical protein